MRPRKDRWPLLVGVGLALLAGHLAAARVLSHERSTPLTVTLERDNPIASAVVADDPSRVELTIDGARPTDEAPGVGLHYIRWAERYRGGFVRSVGAAHVVGRRQNPESPPCSIRLRIGQKLLDDGQASPGTIANLARELLEAQLDGVSAWPIGDFRAVGSLSLQWANGEDLGPSTVAVLALAGEDPPAGYIALNAELQFERAKIPIFVALVPELEAGELRLRALAAAKVRAENPIYRAVARLINGDRRATDIAQSELASTLTDVLEPPPPIELPGGQTIRVAFCRDRGLSFQSLGYGELPLAVVLRNRRGDELPLELPVAASPTPKTIASAIELALDANALGALLHQLWASGFLDDALATADLSAAFNRDPSVVSLLSVRAGELTLVGPPIIAPSRARIGGAGFDIGAELAVAIEDGPLRTPARLFARGHVEIGDSGEAQTTLLSKAELREVDLACRPRPDVLRACYSTLVNELSRRAPEASQMIASWLERSLANLIRDRFLSIEGIPARLDIGEAHASDRGGVVVIDFDGAIVRSAENR